MLTQSSTSSSADGCVQRCVSIFRPGCECISADPGRHQDEQVFSLRIRVSHSNISTGERCDFDSRPRRTKSSCSMFPSLSPDFISESSNRLVGMVVCSFVNDVLGAPKHKTGMCRSLSQSASLCRQNGQSTRYLAYARRCPATRRHPQLCRPKDQCFED